LPATRGQWGYQHPPPGAITAQFAKYGFVIVRALTRKECKANNKEQVTEILQKQPWREKLVVRDRETGEALDIRTDTRRYIKELTRDNIPTATLKHYERVWPFHVGVGACCDPNVFHLQGVWRLREGAAVWRCLQNTVQNQSVGEHQSGIRKLFAARIEVPKRCAIFWSQWLLHGVEKRSHTWPHSFGHVPWLHAGCVARSVCQNAAF
jgi:hypothetical protein